MEQENKPVAWAVKNGVCHFQIWYEKDMADRVAAEQQKRHDLSGSLAAFHVVQLYEHNTEELEAARRTAEYWKSNHLAGNELITRYRAVMEQAVEALESCDIYEDLSGDIRQGFSGSKCKNALTALREALEEE